MRSVRYERSGGVGHIILSNPPHNLLNVDFYEELREAVRAATDQDIRALLVRAEGPNFTKGGDVAVLAGLGQARSSPPATCTSSNTGEQSHPAAAHALVHWA